MLRVGRVVRSNGRIDALLKISWPRISISWHSPCCSLACFHFLGLSSAFVFFFFNILWYQNHVSFYPFFCVFEFVATVEMDFRVNLNSLKRNMLFWFGSTFPLGACILERFCSGSIGGWELFKSPWKEGVHTQRLFERVENIPISLTSSLLIPAAPWYDSLDHFCFVVVFLSSHAWNWSRSSEASQHSHAMGSRT